MKKGIFARLRKGRQATEFESSGYWQPPLTVPAPATIERSPIMERHVRLTLVQSLICGFFVTGLPLVVALFVSDDWRVWLATVVCFFLLTSGISWFLLFFKDRKLLWSAEEALGIDLNRDGGVGEPEIVRGEITDKDRRQRINVEFPFPNDRLRAVAQAILRGGAAFSRRGLSNVISESQFHTLQQEFLKRGLCYWKNPESEQQGVDLSPGGRAFLRMYLKR
jgi:hypothetical protein